MLPATALAVTLDLTEPENPIIIMRYQDMIFYNLTFPVSGVKGTYTLDVTGASNVTKINATLQIQKKNANGAYSNYGSAWTSSSSGRKLYGVATAFKRPVAVGASCS